MREKTFVGKKIVSQLSAIVVTRVVSLDTHNQVQVFKESGELARDVFVYYVNYVYYVCLSSNFL